MNRGRSIFTAVILGLLAAIAVLGSSIVAAVSEDTSPGPSASAYPTDDPTKSAILSSIAAAQSQQVRAAVRTQKPTDSTAISPPQVCISEAWEEGIRYEQQTMLPKGVIDATSNYGSTIGKLKIVAYAGASYSDLHDGLVVFQTFSECGQLIGADIVSVLRSGSLTIGSVDYRGIHLVADSGLRFLADVQTHVITPET